MRKCPDLEYAKRKAEEYFAMCDRENALCDLKQPLSKPYTFSGLLCALAMSREDFERFYESREGRRFANYVLMKIEAFIEENALSGRLSATFAQGALKYSFGWGEKKCEEAREISISLSEEAASLGE